ncbi:MAG: pilus assembly protein N-terminal domain-containing protein [Sulfuritalea sp.]|jgi:pilus assembly protein CpaC|nr:pilus assembly protein N-terminal domain-containing protein [Sulfuritalea sp.]
MRKTLTLLTILLAVSGGIALAQQPVAPAAAAAKSQATPAEPAKGPQSVVQQIAPPKTSAKTHGTAKLAKVESVPVVSEIMPVIMYVGEVKTLPVTGVTRVAVGNGKLVSSTVLDTEVLLLAEAPGDSSLYFWFKDGSVKRYKLTVHASDTETTLANLKAMIGTIPGITFDRVGDTVVVNGMASRQNLGRIDAALKTQQRVLNLVREEDVTMKKMVFMKVQIMEFKKSALENLGVDWSTAATGPAMALTADAISNRQFRFSPETIPATFALGKGAAQALNIPGQAGRMYFGIASAITSNLNLAISNGDAWILASPELSTRSGGEAKFLAGGQIPIVTAGALGATSVTYKDYGIKLNIKPVADDQSNISASIVTEVSDIDPSFQAVQGNPGFLMRSTESEINVRSGQTIVISGLVDQRSSTAINKFPFLGDVPVLGSLFKSENFRNNRSDLVIFVTPVVQDPAATVNQQRIEKAKDLRERFQNFLGKKGIVD